MKPTSWNFFMFAQPLLPLGRTIIADVKRHYEKIVVGCCFLFIFANIGLASTAFSVHQPYLVAMDGIGDTGGSLILSVRTLVSFVAMLVVDRYYRALDVRVGVSVACLFTAAGFGVYSVAGSLPAFFGGAVLLGLGYGLGGMVAMTYLANRWFSAGIGGVVGFASMGSGLASIVMPLVVVRVIEASSLSVAFRVEGAIAAAVGVVVFALLRNRPTDLGMEPYAGGAGRRGGVRRERHGLAPAPHGERVALFMAMVGVGVFSCCGITYLSVLATSSGFDTVFAATLVSTAGIALTIAKFVVGELFDHLGAPRASAVMFACALAGFALACFVELGSAPLMVVAAVLIGAGLSLGTVGISVWSIDAQQIKNFQVAYALGGFIANTLPGIVKDLVGTYVVSYAGVCAIIALAAVIVLRYYRTVG
ncbi:MAG: MFS transporter [Eggerthellaceae bacterium]|nr:MFS transporter [Eggerthellaceae bacterium]